jgi:hypothetical protein
VLFVGGFVFETVNVKYQTRTCDELKAHMNCYSFVVLHSVVCNYCNAGSILGSAALAHCQTRLLFAFMCIVITETPAQGPVPLNFCSHIL